MSRMYECCIGLKNGILFIFYRLIPYKFLPNNELIQTGAVQGWRAHRHPHPPTLFSLFDFIIISSIVMPRLIILHPRGGASGINHHRYTAREKIANVLKICRVKRETNCSYRQAAAFIGISHTLKFLWHVLREHFNSMDIKKLPHYSDYQGHCGQLEIGAALVIFPCESKKKSFGSTYARKIEAKKTSLSTMYATPKIGDFHFR